MKLFCFLLLTAWGVCGREAGASVLNARQPAVNLVCHLELDYFTTDNCVPTASARTTGTGDIVAREHYALRDGLRIYLWEKYAEASAGDFSRTEKVVLLVHGATWSGRPDFDLQIRDYSLMDFLARNGYDVWAIDIHGYGHSHKTDKDDSDTLSASEDIGAAVNYITKLRALKRVSLLGWSWGTQTAGLYTMRHPEMVNKLILYGMVWKGDPAWKTLPLPKEQYRNNTDADAREDFVSGQYEPDVVEKYVKEILATDPKTPNGVRIDARTKLPMLAPERIRVPTLIIRAEKDPAIKEEEALEFLGKLGTNNKSYIALPDGGHVVLLEKNHRRVHSALLSFLNQP